MRLLTHNLLSCLRCQAFPLRVSASEVQQLASDYDAAFTRSMLTRIDYGYLVDAYTRLRDSHESVRAHEPAPLPATLDELTAALASNSDGNGNEDDDKSDEDGDDGSDDVPQLRAVHYALDVVAVKEGQLTCPECGSSYAVHDYIPNFVLDGK